MQKIVNRHFHGFCAQHEFLARNINNLAQHVLKALASITSFATENATYNNRLNALKTKAMVLKTF